MNSDKQDLQPGSDESGLQMDTRGRRPAFFESAETDALMTALLETMSQLWATRSRIRALEQILIDKAITTAEELEAFDFSQAEKENDRQFMEDFFKDAFRAMGAEFQSIDNRQTEVDRFQNYQADKKNKSC